MTTNAKYVIVTFILQDGDMSNSIRVPLYSASAATGADGAASVDATSKSAAPTLRRIAKDAMRRFVVMRRRNDNPQTHSLSEALRRATNKQIAVTEMFVGVKGEPQAEVFPNDLVTHVVQLDKEVIFLKLVILPAEPAKPSEAVRPPRPHDDHVASEPLLNGSSDTLTRSRTSSAPRRNAEVEEQVVPLLREDMASNETTNSVPLLVVKENPVYSQGTTASTSTPSVGRSPAPVTPLKEAQPREEQQTSPKAKTASSQKKRSRTKEEATLFTTTATPPKRQSVERYETPSLSMSHSHARENSSPPALTINPFVTQTKTAASDADDLASGSDHVPGATPLSVARQLQFPSDNSTPGETAKEPSVEFIASRRSSTPRKSKNATPIKEQTPHAAESVGNSTGNKTLPHHAALASPSKRSSSSRKVRQTPPSKGDKSTSSPARSSRVSKALFQTSPNDVPPPSTPVEAEVKETMMTTTEPPENDSPGIRARRNVQLPAYFAELFRPKTSDYSLKDPFFSGKY